MQVLVRSLAGPTLVVGLPPESGVEALQSALLAQHPGVAAPGCRLLYGGRQLRGGAPLAEHGVEDGSTLTQVAGLAGGKGGFGAMLRGIGRTGKLTDNFDACRDLNGRRIRHQEAEKKLAEWAAGEKEREMERAARAHIKQQAKEERQRQIEEMNAKIVQEVQETNIKGVRTSVRSGLAVAAAATGTKRKPEEAEAGKGKKALKVWGMDDLGSDSDDDDSDDDEAAAGEARPQGSDSSAGTSAAATAAAPVAAAAAAEEPPKEEQEQQSAQEEEAKEEPSEAEPVDVSKYGSAEELAAQLGAAALKAELQRLGLKCGGSAKQRAERLFLLKSTPLDKLDRSHFAKK